MIYNGSLPLKAQSEVGDKIGLDASVLHPEKKKKKKESAGCDRI
jgi:hypothetical protein